MMEQCGNPDCSNNYNDDDLKQCGKCKCIKYCSRSCQVYHWKSDHKNVCNISATDAAKTNTKTAETKTQAAVLSKKEIQRKQKEILRCYNPLCTKFAPQLRCACKSAYYCSKDCQERHWSLHKLVCKLQSTNKNNIDPVEKLYNNWRYPRHKKLMHLACMLFPFNMCRTHFVIIHLFVEDETLRLEHGVWSFHTVIDHGDDNLGETNYIMDSSRKCIMDFQNQNHPSNLNPAFKDYKYAYVFFFYKANGVSNIRFWPCGLGPANSSLAVTYTEMDIKVVVESINNTSSDYIPSDKDYEMNSYYLR